MIEFIISFLFSLTSTIALIMADRMTLGIMLLCSHLPYAKFGSYGQSKASDYMLGFGILQFNYLWKINCGLPISLSLLIMTHISLSFFILLQQSWISVRTNICIIVLISEVSYLLGVSLHYIFISFILSTLLCIINPYLKLSNFELISALSAIFIMIDYLFQLLQVDAENNSKDLSVDREIHIVAIIGVLSVISYSVLNFLIIKFTYIGNLLLHSERKLFYILTTSVLWIFFVMFPCMESSLGIPPLTW